MIQPGQLVYSSDGALLGTVTEVGDAYAKLSAPFSIDYWLPLECIDATDTALLRSTFPHADLERFRKEPGSLGARR